MDGLILKTESNTSPLLVENYRRQPRASTDADQSHTLIQHAENEILISNSGKINRYVTVGLELLEVKDFFTTKRTYEPSSFLPPNICRKTNQSLSSVAERLSVRRSQWQRS